jgi:cytochrome b561
MALLVNTRRFPPRRFHAITLFPFVFYNGQPLNGREVRHETVHLWQQAALMLVGFYVLYFVFWLIGLLRYRNSDRAYREIPFERSAYILESKSDVSPARQSYHWITCIIRNS